MAEHDLDSFWPSTPPDQSSTRPKQALLQKGVRRRSQLSKLRFWRLTAHRISQLPSGTAFRHWVKLEIEAVRERLDRLVPKALHSKTKTHAMLGDPVKRIRKLTEKIDALCILMGVHGKGMLRRMLFGTTTLSVLNDARCPMWFMPEGMMI